MYCVLSPLVVINVFSVSVLDPVPSFVHFVLTLLGICCTSAIYVLLSFSRKFLLSFKVFFLPIFLSPVLLGLQLHELIFLTILYCLTCLL